MSGSRATWAKPGGFSASRQRQREENGLLSSRLARHRKIVEPEVVGESDSEVEGEAWHVEREDTSEEEEEEVDDEVRADGRARSGAWGWTASSSNILEVLWESAAFCRSSSNEPS